jgi:hypothetical protein
MRGRVVYANESEMYKDVIPWFSKFLQDRHKKCSVKVFDTSRTKLWRLLERLDYQHHFPDYQSYEVNVDITGVIENPKRTFKKYDLAFIECKLGVITLKDIGQLWGYSMVAKPLIALIISPQGISRALQHLFANGRYDLLGYGNGKRMRIVQWCQSRNDIVPKTLIPSGEFI